MVVDSINAPKQSYGEKMEISPKTTKNVVYVNTHTFYIRVFQQYEHTVSTAVNGTILPYLKYVLLLDVTL